MNLNYSHFFKHLFATTTLVVLTFIFSSTTVFAQKFGAGMRPIGVTGSAGAGVMNFQVESPNDRSFTVDQGTFTGMTVERGFGFLNLYLNLSLAYMSTKGKTNYNYTAPDLVSYSATNVDFKADIFQGGLGLKMKLIDGYWFRPYIEGGGLGGYFQMKFTNLSSALPANSTGYKTDDSLMDFGSYAEGGVEIQFSNTFGIRAAGRFTDNTTKDLETLGRKPIRYKASIYYLSLLVGF